jgi:hypothetical protein
MTSYFHIYGTREGTVRWRLLAANNRELGRSAGDFPDFESAALAAKLVVNDVAALRARVSRSPGGGWVWRLLDDTGAVAEAGRPMDRAVRCEAAVARFVERVGDAVVRDQHHPGRPR